MVKHSKSEIKGTGDSVGYWITLDGDYKCVHEYARVISQTGEEGTGRELALISKIYKRRIVIWTSTNKDPKNGIKVIADYRGHKPSIHLLYSGNHYQLLSFE